MQKITPKILKGFRDFLPQEARKRQYVIDTFKRVFESYGFEPLETPVLEYEEILTGKYGDEGDKLMYRFTDQGGRRVAMRYDQTVPLARVVAQYQNELPLPFKRYQIQSVWRAENTQKGRYREFTQCDIDTVGTASLMADAEIVALAINALERLDFKEFKVIVNDRNNLKFYNDVEKLSEEENVKAIRSIDKMKKIGREGVLDDLTKSGFSVETASFILQSIENKKPTKNLLEIFTFLKQFGLDENKLEFDPTLARGLDYYTGLIFEIEIEGYAAGSVCGGGRYDNLIGMFGNNQVPAVGCAFGFDRIMDAMDEMNLFPKDLSTTKVLITVFSPNLLEESLKLGLTLRENNINAEVYLDKNAKIDKQLKYADKKGIPFVAILGPDEVKENKVAVKNMNSGEQEKVSKEKLLKLLGS